MNLYYLASYICSRCNATYAFRAPHPMSRRSEGALWLWELDVLDHKTDCIMKLVKKEVGYGQYRSN